MAAKVILLLMSAFFVVVGLGSAALSAWLAWHAVEVRSAPLTALFGVVFMVVSLWFAKDYALVIYRIVKDDEPV